MADDFDISRIDEVIHGRIRLGIMAYLSGAEAADFNTLKARLQTTDGTLHIVPPGWLHIEIVTAAFTL